MTHLLRLAAMVTIMAGCSAERSADSRLLEAERETVIHPYTALRMLQPYTADSFPASGDRALFQLLLTESMHSVGVVLVNDSAIAAARDYYEHSGDRPRTARAQLHHALTLYEQGRRYDAVALMKRAERTASGAGSPAFLFSLYDALGAVNEKAHDTGAALACYRRALLAALSTADTTLTVRGFNNVVRVFCASGQTDSARIYINRCKPLLSSIGGEPKAEALTCVAFLQMADGQRDKALLTLGEAHAAYPHYRAMKLQADICAASGDTARACELWYQVLDSRDPELYTDAYDRLISHFYATRRYDRAAYLATRRIGADSLARRGKDLAQIMSIQDTADREAAALSRYRTIALLQWAVLLLAVAVAAVIAYHRRSTRRQNRRYEAYLQRYNTVRTELAELRAEQEAERTRTDNASRAQIETLAAENEQLQRRLAEYQDDRRRPDEWNMDEQLMQATAVARLHNLAARGREAATLDWTDLHRLAADHLPSLLALLNTSATVNAKEINVCLLIRLRFIPSEIATLTGTSPQTITNMRVRLLQKLFGERGGARDFDARIREMR